MDVYDFCMLCTDDSVVISVYDLNEDVSDEVFHGEMHELLYGDKWLDNEVMSFDLNFNDQYFCLNIDTSDDEEEDE